MIVVHISDPHVRAAASLAAHPEEDVILDRDLVVEAVESGFPRLLLAGASESALAVRPESLRALRVVTLTDAMLSRWNADRRRADVPIGRVEFLTDRLRGLVEREPSSATWVDRALGDLGRAAGAALPIQLRAFARRILEFPSHYKDLHPVAERCGLTRGALKARFRRRDLPSPYTYLRWFRLIASANVLADRSVTVAQAAHRIGFTSDGNLCRSMQSVVGLTPTEVRTVRGWNRLLITFAWKHLSLEALERWRTMDELFVRHAA